MYSNELTHLLDLCILSYHLQSQMLIYPEYKIGLICALPDYVPHMDTN